MNTKMYMLGQSVDGGAALIGVVALMTPWSWPFIIATWHLFSALKAKNCVINKPSEYTPLSTILLVEIINRHLPAGVCNLVLGAAEVGSMLSRHPGIAKLSFTGSMQAGKLILQQSAYDFKSVLLELGGHDIGIVLAGVDVDEVAEKIFEAAFLNDDPLMTEEQFGPVLPILPFDDLDQVIAQNNQLDCGLGASVWSKDIETAHEIAIGLQSGTVWINSHCDLSPQVAFGGWKHSGLGFSFGMEGLLHYTRKQAIHMRLV